MLLDSQRYPCYERCWGYAKSLVEWVYYSRSHFCRHAIRETKNYMHIKPKTQSRKCQSRNWSLKTVNNFFINHLYDRTILKLDINSESSDVFQSFKDDQIE